MISEQIRKRRENQQEILEQLHFHGPLQRTGISRATGIRKNSVTSITGELLSCGLLREESPGSMRSALFIAVRRCQVAAAAIAPGVIGFGLVDLAGEVTSGFDLELAAGSDPSCLVPAIRAGFNRLLQSAGTAVIGCGIACPGLIDPLGGICLKAVNLGIEIPLRIGPEVAAGIGRPVFVEHDARSELWACTWYGGLPGNVENLLYVSLCQGVGCALMSRGRLVIGERFAAGEIGHVRVAGEGRLCRCGRRDCLECYCSAGAILGEARRRLGSPFRDFGELAAAEAHPEFVRLVDEAACHLARGIAGLVAAMDPHAVVLSTPSRSLSRALIPGLRRHLAEELSGLTAGETALIPAEDATRASLRGIAGMLAKKAFGESDFTDIL